MIRIDVTPEVLEPSKPNRPRQQIAYAHVVGRDGKALPHPERIFLPIWSDEKPYAPGAYSLAPQSIFPDKWRALALSPKLLPISATR